MYHLFERYGIELEYMIVNRDTLDILPVSDKVLNEVNGGITNEINTGDVSWSNELVLHVIELKTAEPVINYADFDGHFYESIQRINQILKKYNARLMPGPMHPFMDPFKQMYLWPHDYNPIYTAFDKIFSCKGHGWANLQSMHINLPFANDEEFARLHTAIRLVLPIIPAISAGSPVADGVLTGMHDTRMEMYRKNSIKIPSITGGVIPDLVFTQDEYEEKILKPIYHDLDPYDPEKILQEEWVNSRGAIARFERNTIEIRVIDVQENPSADLAIASMVIGLIKLLVGEKIVSFEQQKVIGTGVLKTIFEDIIRIGENGIITDQNYLSVFGQKSSVTARELWCLVAKQLKEMNDPDFLKYQVWIETILNKGTLATRLIKNIGLNSSKDRIFMNYMALCDCLEKNQQYF
jgi:carboxylate-amine ligase